MNHVTQKQINRLEAADAMRYVSLFSGVGGFDLGFDAAGWKCVAQVEWDKDCQQVLARHWPNVPRWGDVSEVCGAELPVADVISFGSPCQDLSVAGKRAGLDGERSGLFHQAIRIIREMRDATDAAFPRIAIWENVVGAMSSNGGADFGVVLDSLADAGALVIEWAVVDARHVGVPQRRRRVFVVAVFDPAIAERCGDQILSVGPRSGWHPPTRPAAWPRPASTIEGSVGTARAYSRTGFAADTEGVGTLASTDHKRPDMHVVTTATGGVTHALTAAASKATTEDGTGRGVPIVTTHTHTNALTCGLATGGPDLAHAEAGWLVGISSGGERGSTVAEPGTRCSANDRHRRSDMGGEQMSDPEPTVLMASGFKAGQSDGGIGYEDEVAPTLNAAMSSLEPTVLAFSAGNSADAHGIGLTVEGTPPLRAAASGSNQVPTVLAFGHTQGLDLQVSSEATPTLRSKGDGAAVSTTAHVRRLTPLECERLMGWPDDHTLYRADGTVQPDSTRYRQCGNGVVANVAEWIAQQINRIVAS